MVPTLLTVWQLIRASHCSREMFYVCVEVVILWVSLDADKACGLHAPLPHLFHLLNLNDSLKTPVHPTVSQTYHGQDERAVKIHKGQKFRLPQGWKVIQQGYPSSFLKSYQPTGLGGLPSSTHPNHMNSLLPCLCSAEWLVIKFRHLIQVCWKGVIQKLQDGSSWGLGLATLGENRLTIGSSIKQCQSSSDWRFLQDLTS